MNFFYSSIVIKNNNQHMNYSLTFGETVIYKGKKATIKNLGWCTASIQVEGENKTRIVFKKNLGRINK